MKRIAYLVMISALIILAMSGFKNTVSKGPEIRDCMLQTGNAIFAIGPGFNCIPENTSLHVKIYDNTGSIAALGSRKIELLHIPAEGINFRVPLSKHLKPRHAYTAAVSIESNTGVQNLEWNNLKVTGISSSGFFEKNFKPITEPLELRNQISAAKIRHQIGLH